MFNPLDLAAYPLRQSLLPGADGLGVFANLGLVDWLSRPDRYLVVCEGRGGCIYAADESMLDEARQVIREAHGDKVVMRPPLIHTYVDPAIEAVVEPVMFLRIKTPDVHAPAVLRELDRRATRMLEQDHQRRDLVVRAEGRLADLMGLARAIEVITGGSAVLWNWLDRYDPVKPPRLC